MLLTLFSTDPDWVKTIARVTLGVIFFAHGSQKLLGWVEGPGLKETMRTMHEVLGLPVSTGFRGHRSRVLWRGRPHRRVTEPRGRGRKRRDHGGCNFDGAR